MSSVFQMDFWPELEGNLEGSRTNTDSSLQSFPVKRRRAKKTTTGQRVHKCEHPGCNKVFTRAEHRRRHEFTHTTLMYTCIYKGCKRKYKRVISLLRHQRQHKHLPPEKNPPPLVINVETLKVPSISQLNSPSAQPPHTPDMRTLEVEDISPPAFGCGESFGELFQETVFADNSLVFGSLAPESLVQASPLQRPDTIDYPAHSVQLPPLPAGLEATIYQCLRRVLRPDAFRVSLDSPNADQMWDGNGIP